MSSIHANIVHIFVVIAVNVVMVLEFVFLSLYLNNNSDIYKLMLVGYMPISNALFCFLILCTMVLW